MKIFIITSLLLTLFSCCKRNECADTTKGIENIINANVLNSVKEFEQECDLQDKKYPVVIYFTDSISNSLFFKNDDTIMIISFYDVRTNFPAQHYKGILKVDSIPIIIYDKDNIGMCYYDSTKLTQETVNATNLELIMMSAFIIKQDGLHRWHPPL